MKRYVGFYPPGDFWVLSNVDIREYSDRLRDMLASRVLDGGLGKQFEAEMSQEVVKYEEPEYEIKVCRDGLILFKHALMDWEKIFDGRPDDIDKGWAELYDLLNCVSLSFHSTLQKRSLDPMPTAMMEFRETGNQDMTVFSWDEHGRCLTIPLPDKSLSRKFKRRSVVSSFDENCLFDMLRLMQEPVLDQDFFDTMNSDLRPLLQERSSIRDVSRLAKSLEQMKTGNYSISHVLSWFLIESELDRLWKRFLEDSQEEYDDGQRRINSERKDDLLENQALTAYVKSQVLELARSLSLQSFKKIHKARKVRNDIVHNAVEATLAQAGEAMEVVQEIIKAKTSVELKLNKAVFTST